MVWSVVWKAVDKNDGFHAGAYERSASKRHGQVVFRHAYRSAPYELDSRSCGHLRERIPDVLWRTRGRCHRIHKLARLHRPRHARLGPLGRQILEVVVPQYELLSRWSLYHGRYSRRLAVNCSCMKIPSITPELGFYYHYKHDPHGPINNYAYEVLGVGCHTEDTCRPEDANMVVYRPLYASSVYDAGKFFTLRPLAMFMESVTKDGATFPRFRKITDPVILQELTATRDAMYNG
jgi:hypothetical protein